jgi:glycosyltransferase involved in cell wall biosynthesis
MSRRILFLYTELADYTIACLKALKAGGEDTRILVIHYPVNAEAPFVFDFEGIGVFRSINEFESCEKLKSFVQSFKPETIVCSGWVNKWYVRVCASYRNKALCIITMDNHWNGSFRQHAMRLIFRLYLKKVYQKIWVPGKPQVSYAKKLGFSEADIVTGFYCCDVNFFDGRYKRSQDKKRRVFPHRFICAARYIPSKGYYQLWDAFIEWKRRYNNDWELWCAGVGEDFSKRVDHEAIRHLGFVQKEDWEKIIENTGIFILASTFEPWGVAVHEFAASGYPLLLSKHVGAAPAFLTQSNGFLFDPLDKEALISKFQLVSELKAEDFNRMAQASNALALTVTPEKWASALLNMRVAV